MDTTELVHYTPSPIPAKTLCRFAEQCDLMAVERSQESISPGDPELRMYIDGEWVSAASGKTREANSPATGEVIGHLPVGGREDARRAIDAAQDAQTSLRRLSAFERAALLDSIADAIESNLEDLTEWLTRDQGKPLGEARIELELTVEMYRNAASEIKHDETPSLQSEDASNYMFTMRQPHGVLGVITPWNFPGTIPSEYLAPGLGVGNTIVWVPAPTTSVFSVKLMEVLSETELPDGALNLVIGDGPVVGNEVVSNTDVDAVGFTGSPETGEIIASDAGAKPMLLELGGNGPVIVMDDANVSDAAERAASGCFGNAGQICTASERILVHEDIIDEFTAGVVDHASSIQVGDPTEPDTDMGPLNNEDVASKMDQHIEDALDSGAELLVGGNRVPDAPTDLYYEPTVLGGVPPGTKVDTKETFGPISPIIPFGDREEAVHIANDIDLGLSSGVFTTDVDTMYYFAEHLETGLVNINEGSAYWEIHTPVGGYSGKQSGVGRIGGRFTIDELSQLKNVIVHTDLGTN